MKPLCGTGIGSEEIPDNLETRPKRMRNMIESFQITCLVSTEPSAAIHSCEKQKHIL